MKRTFYSILILSLFLITCGDNSVEQDVIYQLSTLDALEQGELEGIETFGHLKEYGNFGLGTFHGLNGEMIYLDGQFYQVRTDGFAYNVNDSLRSPFVDITHFETDHSEILTQPLDFNGLTSYLDDQLADSQGFYAIRMNGTFAQLTTRSVAEQNMPYPGLNEALANQVTFDYNQISGTMVGFRMPDSVEGVGIPGYHFHFISSDRQRGGHVLTFQISNVTLEIDNSDRLELIE